MNLHLAFFCSSWYLGLRPRVGHTAQTLGKDRGPGILVAFVVCLQHPRTHLCAQLLPQQPNAHLQLGFPASSSAPRLPKFPGPSLLGGEEVGEAGFPASWAPRPQNGDSLSWGFPSPVDTLLFVGKCLPYALAGKT